MRVFVAGPYSADNVIDVLRNIGRGQKVASDLFVRGFMPFCPWHDKQYVIDNFASNLNVEQFRAHSLAWLEVSEAVVLVHGWEGSQGTLAEIKKARQLDIPVFENIDELEQYASSL